MATMSLLAACIKGCRETVTALLADDRVDPRGSNNEPLRHACYYGHVGVTRLLLADGRADPCASDNEASWHASWPGHAKVIRLLLADGRADCRVGIKKACQLKHTAVVRACVSARSTWFACAKSQLF